LGEKRGLCWRITTEALQAEFARQGTDTIDLKFCLQWHANDFNTEGQFVKNLARLGEPSFSNDPKCLTALVHFILLESLELIADDGGVTVLGNVLKDVHRRFQEPALVALEMMKFGVLNGEPFDAATPERPFPEGVHDPKQPVAPHTRSVMLLSRVMSLVPMRLKSDMWNATVEFDLAAFHCLVKILKRALRQLTEAAVSSALLMDLSRAKLLPKGFMCSSPKKSDPAQTSAVLPTFIFPRACTGIVVLFFLSYRGDAGSFTKELRVRFPCCRDAKQDLRDAFLFWNDLRRCVDETAEPLQNQVMSDDFRTASGVLAAQQKQLGVFPPTAKDRA
jgi:hypothetical protein